MAFGQLRAPNSLIKSGSYARAGDRVLTDPTGERRNQQFSQRFRGLRPCPPNPSGESGFEPAAEFFDRSSVPKEIADLWDEWRELDADTARLVRAAVSSRSPRQLRLAWGMLATRAELARAVR